MRSERVSVNSIEAILEPPGEICDFDADLESVARALHRAPGCILPVVAGRRGRLLVGEVSEDALELARRRWGSEFHEFRVADIARPAVRCQIDDAPEAVLAIMRAHGRWVLHVVDAHDALCGAVSIERVYAHSDPVAREENAPGTLRLALAAVPERVLGPSGPDQGGPRRTA